MRGVRDAAADFEKEGSTVRPICWFHISDVHLQVSDTWSHDVVLKAMCDHIAQQRTQGISADFILATGDLACYGKRQEYPLVAQFFNALSTASGVPKERIFCIPGNHDIDRDRQRMSFRGAREHLQNQIRIDEFLVPGEDLATLLIRQENFRNFQRSYFSGQTRTLTDDTLGYVSRLTIDDVQLAIIGLDSAWLAEGGLEDHGKLLIGERQVMNAITLAQRRDDLPHIIVAMAHHPFHLLKDFDRRSVRERIERACQFFHCGHLHKPETHTAGFSATGCLTLAAGASFETRQFENSYSIVTLDLLNATRTVRTIQYDPSPGAFSFVSSKDYDMEVMPADECGVSELALAMSRFHTSLSRWAHYLSALLLKRKADFPIPAHDSYTFGSFDLLRAQPDSALKRTTTDFMAFRNALRVLYKRIPISEILVAHGDAARQYGASLDELCKTQPRLETRLVEHDNDARGLARSEPSESFSHTSALFADLATAQDWLLLREQSRRHVDSNDPAVAIQAKRMLALCLAHSDDPSDKAGAIELYRSLLQEVSAEICDAGNLAILLNEAERIEEAKATVLGGIGKFPADRTDYFFEIGQTIVVATGDKTFREKIETAIAERAKRD